jgi:hypothetical protein
LGERVGKVILSEIHAGLASPLTQTLDRVEVWAYAG